MGGAADKTAVKVHCAQETLELLDGPRAGVPPKGGGALGQGSDAAGGDAVAKEVQGLHPELALLSVDDKAGRLEPLENVGDVQEVLLAGRTADEDIVEVGEGWGAVRHDPVHEALESITRISHAKRHAGILVQPKGSDDRVLGMSAIFIGI